MNVVMISPHFPDNFRLFCVRLAAQGVRVFGIDSQNYAQLAPDLRSSLTEYYRVDTLENYDQVLKAVGYFTHKYGKIDRIESHNEHWLSLDARLRRDFNVFGYKAEDLEIIQSKSKMKAVFEKAKIPVAQGHLVTDLEHALTFIKKVGYPVVAKPDHGVGAIHTYKITSLLDLQRFFETKPNLPYLMEEFIQGEIHTYDGFTDMKGTILYSNSFIFPVGVMETVNDNLDMMYYTQTQIPSDLDTYGQAIVKAFKVQERFFHIEFFRCKDGSLVALEINVRPPGGYSMDMFNFANDLNFYDEFARLVAGQTLPVRKGNTHTCLYVGQKAHNENAYALSKDEVVSRYKPHVVFYGAIASIFAAAIGNYAYILKGKTLDELLPIAQAILMKKES